MGAPIGVVEKHCERIADPHSAPPFDYVIHRTVSLNSFSLIELLPLPTIVRRLVSQRPYPVDKEIQETPAVNGKM